MPNNLGRVMGEAFVSTKDGKSFESVRFKLDSGSDFTTISCDDLRLLGYSQEYLEECPRYQYGAFLASEEGILTLRYIKNVSIKFSDREIQGCRLFFALDTNLHNLLGSDILKYFNREIDYDNGELRLYERKEKPQLSTGEQPIHIYAIESHEVYKAWIPS
ncbi:MAG: hypothetical protein LBS19_02385 [Clostridiales bacterium]|jgi:hypothetical protein|nr:hypothetical protein [Clostridiales bacterium]